MNPSSPSDAAATREELHFRRIDMRGYRRSDGLYEVEGRVTDRKTTEFRPLVGHRHVPPGEPIHDMGVRIVFEDNGPGIADIELALKDGYTSGKGMGLGLGGARRLCNEFAIESAPGKGTRVTIARWK